MGIEPTSSVWKTEVLPLNYARKRHISVNHYYTKLYKIKGNNTLFCISKPLYRYNRRERESNPLIAVLQTAAFPLGYRAVKRIVSILYKNGGVVATYNWALTFFKTRVYLPMRGSK